MGLRRSRECSVPWVVLDAGAFVDLTDDLAGVAPEQADVAGAAGSDQAGKAVRGHPPVASDPVLQVRAMQEPANQGR